MGIESIFSDVPENWEFTTLGDVCKRGRGLIQTGPFGSQLHASDYVPVGIPTIMPKNIGNNRVIEDGIDRITEKDAQRLSKYRVRFGDIVYSRRGDVRRRALIRHEQSGWLCGTGSLMVRFGNAPVDPVYASYYLGHPRIQDWIEQHAVGATMPNLNTSIMASVPFLLPPLSEQNYIAEVLGSLDDKIEHNHQMNQTLESLAHAIFKSWFVDFDPVQAKMDGHQPVGMDTETAALFPDEFEDSALGRIPKGWKLETLKQHIKAAKGLSYKGVFLSDGSDSAIPMHNLNSIYEGGGYKYEGIKYYNGEYKPRHLINPGNVIVANTEQGFDELLIGYPAVVPKYFGKQGVFSHHLYKVTPSKSSPLTSRFIYFMLSHRKMHGSVAGFSNGTTVNMLPSDGLEMPLFVVPPQEVIMKFDQVVTPFLDKQEANIEEIDTLAALRDALLPRLMSGEVRVKNAPKIEAI